MESSDFYILDLMWKFPPRKGSFINLMITKGWQMNKTLNIYDARVGRHEMKTINILKFIKNKYVL